MLVYVLNKNGEPLMPCKTSRARKLLVGGKVKVVCRTPFTIKLLFGSTGYKQEVTVGMDTGSKTIGCAAISNGKVIYQSEVQLRQDVSKKMQQRKMYRRSRRGRKTRLPASCRWWRKPSALLPPSAPCTQAVVTVSLPWAKSPRTNTSGRHSNGWARSTRHGFCIRSIPGVRWHTVRRSSILNTRRKTN